MDPLNAKTDAGAIADAFKDVLNADLLTLTQGGKSVQVLSTPTGRSIASLKKFFDEYLEKPERRQGTATAFNLESLIAIVGRFATKESVIFANPNAEAPTLTAVFDYHPANVNIPVEEKAIGTDWLRHRAVYAPELSEEWAGWLKMDGEYMSQSDFARFIEDHMMQLVVANLDDPTLVLYSDLAKGSFAAPTDLVRLSRGIEISASIAVKQAVTLMSGEISVLYAEVHNDGAGEPLKLPSLFQINVPVFEAGAHVRVIARLRYRRVGAALSWGYQLVQPERAFKGAFDQMVEQINNETSIPVLYGAPEA